MTDDYGDQYDLHTFLRRVISVVDHPLRRRQIERHLTTVDAETVADHLEAVLKTATRGDTMAQELLLPLVDFVQTPTEAGNLAIEAINVIARTRGLNNLGWFLLDPAPYRKIDDRQAPRMRGNAMSLGHRKTAALGWDTKLLERLLEDWEPSVIDRLCQNQRVLEPQILHIVTRRPTLPVILETVAQHARWMRRATVRGAICNNPYAPTGLVLRILPTLGRPFWEATMFSSQLHPAIRLHAEFLVGVLDDRPDGPLPDRVTQVEQAATRRAVDDPTSDLFDD